MHLVCEPAIQLGNHTERMQQSGGATRLASPLPRVSRILSRGLRALIWPFPRLVLCCSRLPAGWDR